MITLLDWVPAWAFLLIHAFVTFEQGVRRDRNRKAEEACAHTEDTTGVTPANASWPAHDAQGRPRTGPGAIAENLPILAHRLAHAQLGRDGVEWRPLTRPLIFRVETDAQCATNSFFRSHSAPTWGCTCGFYAVPADVDLGSMGMYVDLEVMFTGDVIIHEKGYRGAHQTVLSMVVPKCYCGMPAHYVAVNRSGILVSWGCSSLHVYDQQMQSLHATTTTTLMLVMRSGGEVIDPYGSMFWGIVSVETLGHYCPVPIRNH